MVPLHLNAQWQFLWHEMLCWFSSIKQESMLVQTSTSFLEGRGGVVSVDWDCPREWYHWQVFCFVLDSHYFLFWNIVITCKLREVPPRYSGLQSLSRTPWRGEVVSVDSLYFKTKRMWVKDETKDFSMVPFSRTVSINGDNPPPSRGFSTRTGGHCNGK